MNHAKYDLRDCNLIHILNDLINITGSLYGGEATRTA